MVNLEQNYYIFQYGVKHRAPTQASETELFAWISRDILRPKLPKFSIRHHFFDTLINYTRILQQVQIVVTASTGILR